MKPGGNYCMIRDMREPEPEFIPERLIDILKYVGTFAVAIGGTALLALWVYLIVDWLT